MCRTILSNSLSCLWMYRRIETRITTSEKWTWSNEWRSDQCGKCLYRCEETQREIETDHQWTQNRASSSFSLSRTLRSIFRIRRRWNVSPKNRFVIPTNKNKSTPSSNNTPKRNWMSKDFSQIVHRLLILLRWIEPMVRSNVFVEDMAQIWKEFKLSYAMLNCVCNHLSKKWNQSNKN